MKVFVTRRIPENGLEMLREAGLTVDVHDSDLPLSRKAFLERVSEGDCAALVTTLSDRVDAELLDAAGDSLRVVANFAVGLDNVDLDACRARGVAVGHTPGVLTEATAELALLLMLAVSRRLLEGHALAASGAWQGWAPLQLLGPGLSGKTLGVVGMGRIGRAVARRALAFGMEICYYNRRRDPDAERELPASYRDLDDLLRESDVVSLNAPLTPATRHLIGSRELALMKPTAILVNTARGPLVDEAALADALARGVIWGAGLDVFELEPEITDALSTLPNVVLAPHLGSATVAAREGMARLCAHAVIAVLRGERVPHLVV